MASRHEPSGAWRNRLVVLALLALAAVPRIAVPATAAEDPCIATYDRHGNVTGRYCPDGTTKPPPPGARKAARAPDAIDPEQTVPEGERAGAARTPGGKPSGARTAPKDSEIMCGQWKTSGKGCRGIFTILR